MATMFPSEIDSFTTRGEETVYKFLREAARPDTVFLAWYSPDIEDREPDFILFSPDCGLIVLEVKDWLAGQLLEADPKTACLQIGDRQERRKQPMAQAKEYVHALMALLQKARNAKQGTRNELPCPITWGAIFPHMSRADFNAGGLSKVMDGSRVLCWDDLCEESPLVRDKSGASLRAWLKEHFPPLFPFKLGPQQVHWLRGQIFPVVRINLPRRDGRSEQAKTILALDQEQENMARQFGPGKLLLTGPAGSGKTLILAHQAWNLPRMDKNIRRVLITCFNLSLVGYIQRLLAAKGASLGPNGVEVLPFYSLCEQVLGEKLAHSSEETEYYKLVVRETLDRLAGDNPHKGRWDAILVDEGQDFSPEMAEVLLRLLPENGVLTIAEDDNQRLYQQESAWPSIPGLRHKRLGRQYRNTREIAAFAAKLLAGEIADKSGAKQDHESGMEFGTGETAIAGAHGPEPAWIVNPDREALIAELADAVSARARESRLNEIAVLYAGNKSLPAKIVAALEERGILARWASKNESSKRGYDITTDSVTVSTIHSAKGLDFAHVFILGLDSIPANSQNRRLAYVGLTRARESLTLCIRENNGIAAELK